MSTEMVVFDNLKADVQIFVEPVNSIVVTDDETSSIALSVGKKVKEFIKKVEETRAFHKRPLLERSKQIDEYAKKIAEPLIKAEAHLKKQLLAYEDILSEKRREEEKRIQAEREKAEREARQRLLDQQEEAATMAMFMDEKELKRSEIVAQAETSRDLVAINKASNQEMKAASAVRVSGVKRIWKFEIEDASQIPAEYMIPNEVLIGKVVRGGHVTSIPGVKIYQEAGIAI